MNVPEQSLRLISGGIADYPTTLDKGRRADLLRGFGFEPERPVIWGCGTIGEIKGTDLFYDVCLRLHDLGLTDLQAVWAGKPDQAFTHWPAGFLKEHPANRRTAFAGHREKPYLLMRPGDLFLLTSRADSFPLVALEAAERGLPIIAFKDSGGMAEVVVQGAGLLAERENTRHMAALTADLLRSPERLMAMGEQAQRIVLENYTQDRLGEKYVRLFGEVRGKATERD